MCVFACMYIAKHIHKQTHAHNILCKGGFHMELDTCETDLYVYLSELFSRVKAVHTSVICTWWP